MSTESAADDRVTRESLADNPTVPVLEADHIEKTYTSRRSRGLRTEVTSVAALQGVSLKLQQREVCAIVGESGSGKSTLGRHLIGMEAPDKGEVRFDGKDMQTLTRSELRVFRKSIQIVPQDPSSSLNPRMKIGAIIAEPLDAIRAIPKDEYGDRIAETLRKVDLPTDSHKRYPHQFSVGQRQRIAIARAIAVSPRVVVMDEPVSSLDVSVAARVLDLIDHLRDELGMGLLLISHNLGHVSKIAQKVAVVQNGHIVEQGAVREVFANPAHEYTRTLLGAVPRLKYEMR